MGTKLSRAALNRALLARQHLIRRTNMTAFDMIEHLVGIQAQEPKAPYVGLWTRLDDFQPDELAELITSRQTVRIILMRGTIHLVSAEDCLALRPITQVIMDRNYASGPFTKRLAGIDRVELAAAGRTLIEQTPSTVGDLGKALTERWPHHEATALGNGIRDLLPLVQVPPRGLWKTSGRAVCTTAESWLGRPLTGLALDRLVPRYLAAFGPSTVMDIQAWCGLTKLAEVVQGLRPQLAVFENEAGKELFDLPDAPRPDPETPVPVRFMPEFDNILLAHADRTRVISDERLPLVVGGKKTVLVDGYVRATWTHDKAGNVTVEPLERLTKAEQRAVDEETGRLRTFLHA